MADWIDPRTNPTPPYNGQERPLAQDATELTGLIAALRSGRYYDAEEWVANGHPLQMDQRRGRAIRTATPLRVAIAAGSFDLVRLLLCNGYRTELEPGSPLNLVLEARRWDLLGLLLDWGVDPAGADLWRVLATYQRDVFERFWTAGVDLTAGGAMAGALASSARNRPLYGFAKAYRDRDARVQRALDVGLGAAIQDRNQGAISLCRWAGANPRHRVGEVGYDASEDDDGMTAFERAVVEDAPELLQRLGFDTSTDDLEALYEHTYGLNTLRALVAIRPPSDWPGISQRFISTMESRVRLSRYDANIDEIEEVFALGGRLGTLDRDLKRDLRRLLLELGEWSAQRLFRLLRNPENMDPQAFIDLIAHEKLAARYAEWPRRYGIDKELLANLAIAPVAPSSVRKLAKARLSRPKRAVNYIYVDEGGTQRPLSREEIYELVWTEPLLTVARRFGLSDNGLRKRCKAMEVPTPPRGYWQQMEHGHRTKRSPLPPMQK